MMWRSVALAALVAVALAATGCGSQTPAPTPAAARYAKELATADRPSQAANFEHPVPTRFFRKSIAYYRRYAERAATQLGPEVADIRAALVSGNREAAQAAWKVAFARYLSLGAVYGELGRLDASIDGLPGGLPRGVEDSRFTGLHRLEYGLWTGQPLAGLRPVAAQLQANVRHLVRALPTVALPAADFITRAHEILEDAQRDYLSGASVPWSDQGVLATQAAADATRVVFRSLGPLIGQPFYSNISARLTLLQRVLQSIRRRHAGQLPPLKRLGSGERERLDGATSGALQVLQAIPVYLDTTVVHRVPALPR